MGKKDGEAPKRATWIRSKMNAFRSDKKKAAQGQRPSESQMPPQKTSLFRKSLPIHQIEPQQASEQANQNHKNIQTDVPNVQNATPSNHSTKLMTLRPRPTQQRAENGPYQVLRAHGFDLTSKSTNKEQALLWAVENDQGNAVKVLISEGADVHLVDESQETYLHKVAYTPYEKVLALLLSSTVNVDTKNAAGQTALHIAAANGREGMSRRLVDVGADPFTKTPQQKSALDLAIESQDERTVHFFLEKGLEVPLHIGGGDKDEFQSRKASAGLYTVAQLLVAQAIETREKEGSERQALHVMAQKGQVAGVHLLLRSGVNVTAVDKSGRNALHFAAKYGQRKTIEMLSDHHAAANKDLPFLQERKAQNSFINAQDDVERRPVYYAIMNGHVEATRYLLNKGADYMAKDSSDRRAMYWAGQNGHFRVLYLLKAHEDRLEQTKPKKKTGTLQPNQLSENWSKFERDENMVDPIILRWD